MPDIPTILLLSDQDDAGQELTKALDGYHFLIAGISDTIENTINLLGQCAPDFLIIQLKDHCDDFSRILYKFKVISPRTRILVFQKKCNSKDIFTIIKAGAEVILSKSKSLENLPATLSTMLIDDIHLPDFVAASLLEMSFPERQKTTEFPLIFTDKERSILQCYADGMGLNEMENFLGIPVEMAKAYTKNILHKIHFVDIADRYYNEVISDLDSDPVSH